MRPAPIQGACAWRGEELARSPRWIRRLAPEALADIDRALDAARASGTAWHETTRERFPLTTVAELFADVARELEDGCGLVTLRGLPVERYTADELRRIWFGLGSHLGRPVFQNRRGELMREIKDEGREVGARYGQIPVERQARRAGLPRAEPTTAPPGPRGDPGGRRDRARSARPPPRPAAAGGPGPGAHTARGVLWPSPPRESGR
jgi:hypothetical protein